MIDNNQPIGIFDSGIGGLTVARAVREALPGENIIYFGDTAHFPYGEKSESAIQAYAIKICNVLLSQHCKIILIACNSASSAAYELVNAYVGSRARVFNVIDTAIEFVKANYSNSTLGVIGTKRTIASNVYKVKLDALNENIEVRSLATPLLAPMIEEGYFNNNLSATIIQEYISDPVLNDIDALILGCTHYPLIKEQIKELLPGDIDVIDSADVIAASLKNYLAENGKLNKEKNPKSIFYVSDYTQSFKESTSIFFGKEVQLQQYKLWE